MSVFSLKGFKLSVALLVCPKSVFVNLYRLECSSILDRMFHTLAARHRLALGTFPEQQTEQAEPKSIRSLVRPTQDVN